MGVVLAVAHDRKANDVIVNAGDEHVNISGANTFRYSLRCPTPSQTMLNQIPRQVGNSVSVCQSRQSQCELSSRHEMYRLTNSGLSPSLSAIKFYLMMRQ